MNSNGVPGGQLKRVEPFQGLMIDDGIWRDAHNYHRNHQQLHTLLLHGWGIVRGLEVAPNNPPDRTLVIAPGVAIDPEGRLIIVAQPIRYRLNAEEAGTVYLLLTFRDIPTEPVRSVQDGSRRPSRMLEGFSVAEYDRLPDAPYVELARLALGEGENALVVPAESVLPGTDVLDLRFRVEADLRPGPVATIGAWAAVKSGAGRKRIAGHAGGPAALLRELGGSQWQLRWSDIEPGAPEGIACDLLLMTLDGKPKFDEPDIVRLRVFLDEGGVVLAEACAEYGNADARAAALLELAALLGRDPAPVDGDHPLLSAAHIFGAPPTGATEGQLFDAAGLLLSAGDYSCAWRGGLSGKPLERERIRSAQEFGENLLAYALERRRAWKANQ